MTDQTVDDNTLDRSSDLDAHSSPAPQYGVGPFSVREVALAGIWLLAFVVSFFPVNLLEGPEGGILGGSNVWVSGLAWILAIGLPTAAIFLLVLRRLSPQGIRRVGSLGIDQFASVAFSVAALTWGMWLWDTIAFAMDFGFWVRSWVVWVEVILMLAGVALTVFAPLLPMFREDFEGRAESVAHRNARHPRAVSPRPATPRPVADSTVPETHVPAAGAADAARGTYVTGQYDTRTHGGLVDPAAERSSPAEGEQVVPVTGDQPAYDQDSSTASTRVEEAAVDYRSEDENATDVFASLTADEPTAATQEWSPSEETAAGAQPAQQAFWALVPEERDVVDEYGAPLFRIGPTAWALVIEDRGAAFVVRHEDGRIGFLHDVSGVTRG